jgi:hypothetical protein
MIGSSSESGAQPYIINIAMEGKGEHARVEWGGTYGPQHCGNSANRFFGVAAKRRRII